MKTLIPWLALLLGLGIVASGLRPVHNPGAYDIDTFGHLPILVNGRIKPLDTFARTTLLSFQDRQRVVTSDLKDLAMGTDPSELTPLEWLLDVTFRPEVADGYRTFKIDNPEVLNLIQKNDDNTRIEYKDSGIRMLAALDFLPSRYRRFSYDEISPYLAEIERQAQLADSVESATRNAFQRAVLNLHSNLIEYQQLKYSFILSESPDFLGELREFQSDLPKGIEAVRLKKDGQPHDEAMAQKMVDAVHRFETMTRFSSLLVVPPVKGAGEAEWRKVGQVLLDTFKTGEIDFTAQQYATLAYAWRTNKPDQFNQAVQRLHSFLYGEVNHRAAKLDAEVRFNQIEPFYKSMIVYAFAFVVAIFSWLRWPETLGRAAFFLILAAFVTTTIGIGTRMWLEGRPPVTNLYSSALFVGWGAVALCAILEAIYKNGVGTVAGGSIGFCTLLIAHHLALGGDTLEMMRAVLDSNFWLATHVVVVTLGYASTFLAGFLGVIYILMGVFTTWLPKQFDRRAGEAVAIVSSDPSRSPKIATAKGETNGQAINRMIYGIVCFATLFSLIGTILGGIWADQSWGRFWGWDPKENGALIIVIWNALILHARWGGMVKARGLACLAVFGNIVTAWSWFGTNMLGIGLHSYGFMDQAFNWLLAFVASQIILVLFGSILPLENWKSFRSERKTPTPPRGAVAKA